MNNEKIDVVKVINIAGTVLGIAATLLSSYANNKNMEKEIDKKVFEALNKK